jgi:hypothetical protein
MKWIFQDDLICRLQGDSEFPLEPFFPASLELSLLTKINDISETKKEETIMATKKSMWVLFGILVISAWILGSVTQAGAETMKCRTATTATKIEEIPVSDEEGHVLGVQILQGLAFFENGEIAKLRSHAIYDSIGGKGGQVISYHIYTFEDGSTFVVRNQRLMVADKSGKFSVKVTSEIIKGTGRFEGIKGTASATGKTFPGSKDEPTRSTNDFTFTYTLPTK